MSHVKTNLVVATLATLAAMAYMTLRDQMRERRRLTVRHAENRWEGEGGNVPEVALENGLQGRSEQAEVPEHASDIDTRQAFRFPRA
jgi:hypothetical protein